MLSSLSESVMDYKKNGKNLKEIYDRIFLIAYFFPLKFTSWDEEVSSDFFFSFLPKIPSLIKNYKPENNFENYLATVLKWHVRTFIRKSAERNYYSKFEEELAIEEFSVSSELSLYLPPDKKYQKIKEQNNFSLIKERCPFELDKRGIIKNSITRKRLLFVAVQNADKIKNSNLEHLSRLLNMNNRNLFHVLTVSRTIIRESLAKKEKYVRRRNNCWVKYHLAEIRRCSSTDKNQHEYWKSRADYWKRVFEKSKYRIQHMRTGPTHSDIAAILGVPDGTVSSGLFFIKKQAQGLNFRVEQEIKSI